MALERRLGKRRPTLSRARIVDQAGYVTEVWVRDVSSTGVRLETPPYANIPRRFTLLRADRDQREVEAEIVWRNGVDVGARFVTEKSAASRMKMTSPTPIKKIPLAELRTLARRA